MKLSPAAASFCPGKPSHTSSTSIAQACLSIGSRMASLLPTNNLARTRPQRKTVKSIEAVVSTLPMEPVFAKKGCDRSTEISGLSPPPGLYGDTGHQCLTQLVNSPCHNTINQCLSVDRCSTSFEQYLKYGCINTSTRNVPFFDSFNDHVQHLLNLPNELLHKSVHDPGGMGDTRGISSQTVTQEAAISACTLDGGSLMLGVPAVPVVLSVPTMPPATLDGQMG